MMRMPSGGKLRAQVGSRQIRLTILGFAIAALIGFWGVMVLADGAVGFGVTWIPDGLVVAFAIGHFVSAPVAWIIASVTLTSPRRIGAVFGWLIVPILSVISVVAAMTDAWAWNTSAARGAGTAAYLAAVTLVSLGPLSLLALLAVAIRALGADAERPLS